MQVKKVYLENFLSYGSLFVEFEKGLNVLVGSNAAGKTNLLESVYYSSVGKSARGLKDKELITWGADGGARIRLFVEKRYTSHTVDIAIDKQGKKRITVDNLPISKIGELMGVLNIVYFSPTEMRLVKDAPSDRRRFMDISLCQQDKIYFYTLVKYNKLLAQRNKLLKDYYASSSLYDMSTLVTDKMSETQGYLIQKRKEFLDGIAPIATQKHALLTGGKEALSLEYETENLNFDDVTGSLKALYKANYEKDCRLQFTTVGVHRDDIKISADGTDVRKYGSQGQQRTAVLSLKLAEVERFRAVSGEYPILLLDDVLSELDGDRQKALFDNLSGVQTLVTCTDFDSGLSDKKTVYSVRDRKVTKL